MLKAELFGAGRVRFYERELPGFPAQQAGLLLCYLLLNRHHPHHREQLATVFWGDYSSEVARKYLRNTLWRLRQVLQSAGAPPEDYLFISEDSVSFINTSRYWLDVEQFDQAAALVQHSSGADLSIEQAAALARASELYTGDLLENVYEDWCLYERERLRLLHLSNLHKLMVFNGVQGAFLQGIQYGEKILALENTSEEVHYQLMWLHWLSGDRNAALRQYRRCAQVLHDELNVQPMDETRTLYEQMLNDQVPAHRSAPIHRLAVTRSPADIADRPDSAASRETIENTLKPLLVQTIQRLYQLQQMIDETKAEIYQIERRLDQAMLDADL